MKKKKRRKIGPVILTVLMTLLVLAAAVVLLFRTRAVEVEEIPITVKIRSPHGCRETGFQSIHYIYWSNMILWMQNCRQESSG